MRSIKLKTKLAHSWRFEAIGTQWEIVTAKSLSQAVKRLVTQTIAQFDEDYSRFRPDSTVSKAGRTPGTYAFPESARALFDFYDELWELTKGKVSPLVGTVLENAGYDADYSLRPKKQEVKLLGYKEVIERDRATLTLTHPALIDVGAIGKGYLVDALIELLDTHGYHDALVDGSGDMRVIGVNKEVVGLEHPRNPHKVIGSVELKSRALCASASNRRAWGDWHHIIDATTGTPTKEVLATWVVADSALIADGLATALFFASPKQLRERYNYEYLRMLADGSIEYSDYFSKGVFA